MKTAAFLSKNFNARGLLMAGTAFAALMSPVAVLGQSAVSPAAAAADRRDARIDALEADLKRVEAELRALRQPSQSSASAAVTPAPPETPTSAATAGLGQNLVASSDKGAGSSKNSGPNGNPRIFGPGIPTTGNVSSIDAGRPVVNSADGRFTANLLGVMQFDVANYFQDKAGPLSTDLRRAGAAADNARGRNLSNGSTFRRARIGLGGRAFGDFEYSVLFDFGGSGLEDNGHIQELWFQYSGWKPAHIRVGAFAPFIGLEDAGSTNGMLFLERPASADIARSLAGGDFREAGQLTVNTDHLFVSAAITGRLVNTGGASSVQPYNSQLGFIGRIAALPYKDKDNLIHVGLHGSYVAHPADASGPDAAANAIRYPIQLRERPELRVDGTRLIDTSSINADHAYTVGAEAAFQHKNLMLQSEYERIGIQRYASALSDPDFHGFYVEGSWIITGQTRRYNNGNFAFDGPRVDGSFNPTQNNWGAWELALRYSDTELNYHAGASGSAPVADAVRGGDQHILTAGLNWYLNSIMRVMLDYQHVHISRLSPNATTFVTPVGADIGQTYSAGSMRFQLAF